MRWGVLALPLAMLAVAACGSARQAPRPTGADHTSRRKLVGQRRPLPRTDAQLARASLIKPAALPAGMRTWRSIQSAIACGATSPFADAGAIAKSPRYHLPELDIQETVAVFRDGPAAMRAFRLLHSAPELVCFRRRLRRSIRRIVEGRVAAPVVQTLTLEPLGPRRSFAERMNFFVERGPAQEGSAYVDLFQTTAARSVVSLVAIAQREPLSQASDEALASNAVTALQQAAAAGGSR